MTRRELLGPLALLLAHTPTRDMRVKRSVPSKTRQRQKPSLPEGRSERDQTAKAGSPGEGPGIAATVPVPERVASVPEALRSLGASIVWLSGALAGIGAILYALGYFITLANLRMLGLDPAALRYDATFYIERGAGFLLKSASYAVQDVLPPILLALGFPVAFYGSRLLRKLARRLAVLAPFRRFIQNEEVWWAPLFLLLVVLVYQVYQIVRDHSEQMSLSDLLYSAGDPGLGGPIRKLIVCGKEEELRGRFDIFLRQQVLIGVLLMLAWGLKRARPWGTFWTAPFAIVSAISVVVFAISAVLLPAEYGILMLPNKFPQAQVRFKHPMEPAGGMRVMMYLLNKTESEFVFWESDHQSIVWIPSRMLASAEIFGLSKIIKSSEKGCE